MKYSRLLLLPLTVATSLNCMDQNKDQRWDIVRTFEQINSSVRSVDFNAYGTELAMASGDMKSHLFHVNSEEEFARFSNHNQITRAICFENYSGKLIATGSDDAQARVIDTITYQEITSFNNKDIICATKFNHAGNQLAVAANHTVRLFDLLTNKRLISIQHQDQPISVCFDKHDNRIITASLNKVRVFDIRIKEKVESFYRKNRYIASVLTNSDNRILTVETPGDTIQIYNDTTKEIIDTNIPVTVEPANGLDRLYNGESLFSICLHPITKQLALGLFGKALIFAHNNQK